MLQGFIVPTLLLVDRLVMKMTGGISVHLYQVLTNAYALPIRLPSEAILYTHLKPISELLACLKRKLEKS